jgi:hypothetical protein
MWIPATFLVACPLQSSHSRIYTLGNTRDIMIIIICRTNCSLLSGLPKGENYLFNIPAKGSPRWYGLTAVLFIGLLVIFIISRMILGIDVGVANVTGFAVIAFATAIAAGLGGFMGGRVYFITTIIAYIIGVVYMLYIVVTNAADGWSDLTSVISFMTIAVIGIAAGVLVQFIWYLMHKNKA